MTKDEKPFALISPAEWIEATRDLTPEEEGLYITCCSYVFSENAPLPLDPIAASKLLNTKTNDYRRLLARLVAKGKMMKTASGFVDALDLLKRVQ